MLKTIWFRLLIAIGCLSGMHASPALAAKSKNNCSHQVKRKVLQEAMKSLTAMRMAEEHAGWKNVRYIKERFPTADHALGIISTTHWLEFTVERENSFRELGPGKFLYTVTIEKKIRPSKQKKVRSVGLAESAAYEVGVTGEGRDRCRIGKMTPIELRR